MVRDNDAVDLRGGGRASSIRVQYAFDDYGRAPQPVVRISGTAVLARARAESAQDLVHRQNEKGPSCGALFVLAECGCGRRILFDGRSGAAACPGREAPIQPSKAASKEGPPNE